MKKMGIVFVIFFVIFLLAINTSFGGAVLIYRSVISKNIPRSEDFFEQSYSEDRLHKKFIVKNGVLYLLVDLRRFFLFWTELESVSWSRDELNEIIDDVGVAYFPSPNGECGGVEWLCKTDTEFNSKAHQNATFNLKAHHSHF